MNTSPPTHSHRTARYAVAAAMMTALPLGLVAAPVNAEPVVAAEHPWQPDCDHNGQWQWQQNRGNWEWNNCDNVNGHWEWRGDRGHENWQWHRDRDVAPPPPMVGRF